MSISRSNFNLTDKLPLVAVPVLAVDGLKHDVVAQSGIGTNG